MFVREPQGARLVHSTIEQCQPIVKQNLTLTFYYKYYGIAHHDIVVLHYAAVACLFYVSYRTNRHGLPSASPEVLNKVFAGGGLAI